MKSGIYPRPEPGIPPFPISEAMSVNHPGQVYGLAGSADSVKAAAERSMLTTISAKRAGVHLPEPMGLAQAGDSIMTVMRVLPPTASLKDLAEADALTDEILDEAWKQLVFAHAHAISHRHIAPSSLVVDESSQVWLIHWDEGEVATNELNQRIDVAQMLTLLAIYVGKDRALASARRNLSEEALVGCAPVLQKAVLPSEVTASLRRSDLLDKLREGIVADTPQESVQPANLQRFAPKTMITFAVLALAAIILMGSLNFSDIVAAVKQANPIWIAIAFAFAAATWVGGRLDCHPGRTCWNWPRRTQPALPDQAEDEYSRCGYNRDSSADFTVPRDYLTARHRFVLLRILTVCIAALWRDHRRCRSCRPCGDYLHFYPEDPKVHLVEDRTHVEAGLSAPHVGCRPAPAPPRGSCGEHAHEHRFRRRVLGITQGHGRVTEPCDSLDYLLGIELPGFGRPLPRRYRSCRGRTHRWFAGGRYRSVDRIANRDHLPPRDFLWPRTLRLGCTEDHAEAEPDLGEQPGVLETDWLASQGVRGRSRS